RMAEAEPLQYGRERPCRRLVDRELDEFGAMADGARRQGGGPTRQAAGALAQAVEQRDQRALPVHRDAPGRPAAELVVEDFEREQALVAGGAERLHEVEERQIALPRQVAEMAAPREIIHLEQRR